ncbi:DUF1559 family PulG-like putative transporter [Gemmata sp.]|uniref:DUF1559 family PulG-like putative transporter n=1 Tax=Gemmata sp. TaxID=1914242 RepID=UPI003F70756F
MVQPKGVRWWGGLAALAAAVAATSLPREVPQAVAGQPVAAELPGGLRYVPTDAALFGYLDAPKVWGSAIVKNVRNSDPKTIELFTTGLKAELGFAVEDVKSVVVFVPSLKGPRDADQYGLVLTFAKAFEKERIEKGVAKLLRRDDPKVKVTAPDDRTAVVLVNLYDEFAKPRAAKPGPLDDALRAAASGKYAAVAAATLANLPDEIRGDNVPVQVRAFQPLFHAVSISATLDLAADPTVVVRVRAGSAKQATECEKVLGALAALLQEQLDQGLKELVKDAGARDILAVMRAAGPALKGARFETLGSDTQATLTLPGDLPFGGAFVEARRKTQEAAARLTALNNLKQIGLAMHGYHDANGTLPPAAVCDKTGKPLLSWRVLILPYIDQNALYQQFKLDEPWDSANNKKLLAKMPKVYAVPGVTPEGGTDTHFRVFVGNGAGFDWVKGGKLTDIADGTSNTFLCVTGADAVPWTKPDELEFDPEKDPTKLLGAVASGRVLVGMFDGSVRTLPNIPPKDTLKAYITKSGGEVISDDE